MAEIEKKNRAKLKVLCLSSMMGIKVTVDNLMTRDQSLEKSLNSPTSRLKMLKSW